MIRHLNLHLRKLFEKELKLMAEQIGFEPPDENWRKYVSGLNKPALNIYLVDLRENHTNRTNESLREVRNGIVIEIPAPRWVDCHYLITAWVLTSPDIAHGLEPTLEEHTMLFAATSLLPVLEAESLTPRQVHSPDPLPADFPQVLADAALPITVLPGEGFSKLAEFWGTMGSGYRWKPAVYLVATLPVIRPEGPIGPPVTTLVTSYGQKYGEKTEVHIQIGGRVLDTQHLLPDNSPAPLARARVKLESTTGEMLQKSLTNDLGNFIFNRLSEGNYQLHVSAEGIGEKTCPIEVRINPQSTGVIKYDVSF